MKAKLSMAFEDLRGSDGNVTARMSRSGLTLVKKIRPRQAESVARSGVLANMDEIGEAYTSLDQEGVDLWAAYGKSTLKTNEVNGTSYASTAYAAFVAINGVHLRTSATATAILTPPTTVFKSPNIFIGVTPTTGGLIVAGSASTPATVRLEVNVARLARITRALPRKGYVSAGFFALLSSSGNEVRVPLPDGAYALQYRWVSTVDGQHSRWRSLGKFGVGLTFEAGGVDQETGEVMEPAAKPSRAKKAA